MKLLRGKWLPMSMLFIAASAAPAGVIKVTTAPVVHPKRTVHRLAKAAHRTAHVVKVVIY